jgi:peptidoglycan/LPS O-acetylase OafA/YrhL
MKFPYKDRFISLDTLRGVCAVFVAIFHFSTDATITAIPFIHHGFLFVDFFFVLSGFVIAANYGAKLQSGFPLGKFMSLRFWRLYPLHLFVLLLYAGLVAVKGAGNTYPASGFVLSGLLLQIFSDGQLGNWNLPSWSIAAEMWAYLVFAVLSR